MEPGSGPDLGSGSWDPPPPLPPPLWPPAPPPAASTGSAVTQWVIYLLAIVLLLGVPACVCLTARRALEKRHKRRRRHGRETEARRPQKTRLKPFVEASRMTEAQERHHASYYDRRPPWMLQPFAPAFLDDSNGNEGSILLRQQPAAARRRSSVHHPNDDGSGEAVLKPLVTHEAAMMHAAAQKRRSLKAVFDVALVAERMTLAEAARHAADAGPATAILRQSKAARAAAAEAAPAASADAPPMRASQRRVAAIPERKASADAPERKGSANAPHKKGLREGSIEKHTSHATAHPDQKLLYSPREAMTLEERKAARKASLNSWPSEPTTEFPGKEFGDGRGHSRASSAHALAEALRKDAGLPPGPPRRRSKLPLNRFRAAGRAALAAFGAQGDARARRADAAEPVASPPPEVETEPLEDDLEA